MLVLATILLMLGLFLGTAEIRSDSSIYKILRDLKISQNNMAGILIVCGTLSIILNELIS